MIYIHGIKWGKKEGWQFFCPLCVIVCCKFAASNALPWSLRIVANKPDKTVNSPLFTITSTFYNYILGEDRWLCTMLMKEGYTVTYNPSASVYTYVPETLKEFYHQRLRWTPTIVPNTLEILSYWKGMVLRGQWTKLPFCIYMVSKYSLAQSLLLIK